MDDRPKGNDSPWALPPMSDEARRHYEHEFLPRYKQLLADVERTPLTVLIWGPGPSAGDLFAKRRQILSELRQRGVAAVFSEEVDIDVPVNQRSTVAREMAQAVVADFIVVLQASPGSVAEVHDLGAFLTTLGPKLLVFIDERATAGYSYAGILSELKTLYHNVDTFRSPDDISACRLTTAVLSRVNVLRHAKWRLNLSQRQQ